MRWFSSHKWKWNSSLLSTTNKQETFIAKRFFFKAGTSFNVIQKAWIFGFSSSSCKNAHDKNGYWFKTSRQQAAGLKCHPSLRSTPHSVVEHSVSYFNNKAARFSAILQCAFFCFKGLYVFFFGDCPSIYLRVWMTVPPPPLYEGLDPQMGCIEKGTFYLQGNFDYCIRLCQTGMENITKDQA